VLLDISCQGGGTRWQRHSWHVACHCEGYQATCVGACRVVVVQSLDEVLRQVVFSYHDGCEVVAPLLVQRGVQPVTDCTTVCRLCVMLGKVILRLSSLLLGHFVGGAQRS
jgi:hypothetical protein